MNSEQATIFAAHAPKPGKKYFTLDESNQSLVYIRAIVREMCDTYSLVMQLRRKIESRDYIEREGCEAKLEAAMDGLGVLVDELNFVGVEIKDFEKGLIDFPAVHFNREIFYCWHLGEEAVESWHEADTGFAGRQDVALLTQKAA